MPVALHPDHPPNLVTGVWPESNVRGRKFVWLLSPSWNNLWTRQNHFAIRLARMGAEVLYVENPTAWSSALRQRSWADLPCRITTSTQEIIPGIHLMKPAVNFPGGKGSETVARFNGYLLGLQVSRWLARNHWNDYTCWCRVPHSLFPLEQLQPQEVIYDITDDYELYERAGRCRSLVLAREARLLAHANFVAITSPELRAKSNLQNVPTSVVPNGVEYDLFARAGEPGPVHPLVTGLKKPVICYLGLTSHWMDFELLERLACKWPGQVLMLGPIAAQVETRARAIPGLVWGGLIPQGELPPYLRGVDLFVMPHLVNELRKRANPLKIWEYLATGKPFVSVDLPALDPVRHLVDIARNHDEFMALITQRLEKADPNRSVAAQAYARTQSWDAIFAQMLTSFRWQTPVSL